MTATSPLFDHLKPTLENFFTVPVLHRVEAGETLSKIITEFYAVPYGGQAYRAHLRTVLAVNPQITHPDHIAIGDWLTLQPPLNAQQVYQLCNMPDEQAITENTLPLRHVKEPKSTHYLSQITPHVPTDPAGKEVFAALAWLEENYGMLSTSTGAGFNVLGGLTSQAHNLYVQQIEQLWLQYQRGDIKANQYHYRRRKVLNEYAAKLGPFEKFLYKGQTVHEAIRINRKKAFPATYTITRNAQRLGRLARTANVGGIGLIAAGGVLSCHQIANTQNQQQKNEILVEAVGNSIFSGLSSVGLTLLFASNPTGWATILVLGTAASISSYVAGKAGVWIYNNKNEKIDLVSKLGIEKICY